MAQYTYDMFRIYPFLQFDFILLFLRFYFRYFLNFCVFALAVFRWILSNCRCIKTEFLLYGTRTYATMCVCVREHTRCRAWWCDMFRFHYPKQNIAHGVQVTQSHTNVYAFASYIISREFHDSLFFWLCVITAATFTIPIIFLNVFEFRGAPRQNHFQLERFDGIMHCSWLVHMDEVVVWLEGKNEREPRNSNNNNNDEFDIAWWWFSIVVQTIEFDIYLTL